MSREFLKDVLWSPDVIGSLVEFQVEEVDVDADPDTAEAFAVTGVPTLVLATEEGKIVYRHLGAMTAGELINWIEAGRARLREGVWEGTAAAPELTGLVSAAGARSLGTNELNRLIGLLGAPDPAVRTDAGRALGAQREAAMPVLIEATGNPYLGTRIAAGQLLESLAPEAPVPNPWLSRAETAAAVKVLADWWSRTRELPSTDVTRRVAAEGQAAIEAALSALLDQNPTRRTDAMSRLVEAGTMALPAVRRVIHQRDQAGDERVVLLLEDVRWAILIPDGLERRFHGLRQTLARGISSERQAAAARLGNAGPDALPALVELASDSDPLVVETTLSSLSAAGGSEAISAMSALLTSPDANLRLTAAQSLGRSKNRAAVAPLVSALEDEDGLVVVTALGALEQVISGAGYGSKKPVPPEVVSGINRSLGDSRWRVRATAAEIAGKLSMHEAQEPLRELLDDPDGFVVKNALGALHEIGARPEPDDLLALVRRLPALRDEVIQAIVAFRSAPAARALDELYTQADAEGRAAVLRIIAQASEGASEPASWSEPLVLRSVADESAEVRRAGAGLLPCLPAKTSAGLVGRFLPDQDAGVGTLAAGTVVGLISGRLVPRFQEDEVPGHPAYFGMDELRQRPEQESAFTTNQLASWHELLLARLDGRTNPIVAAAAFLSGQGTNDLPLVLNALAAADVKSQRSMARLNVIGQLLPRLPGEAGMLLVREVERKPLLYAQAVGAIQRADAGQAAHLAETARFIDTFARATAADQKTMIATLTRAGAWLELQRRSPSFHPTLAVSSYPLLRTVAINALGGLGTNHLGLIEAASTDTNVWVRLAALRSLARISQQPENLQARLAPLLPDPDLRVARLAAVGLLEPEVRSALGRESWLSEFQFENLTDLISADWGSEGSDRPLRWIEEKPPWLGEARRQFARDPGEDNAPFAILLAQYGEFEALDQLIAAWRQPEPGDRMSLASAITTGVALSRDAKYVPVLGEMLEQAEDSWEQRVILQGLRGMRGSEARQLRLEINRRIREDAAP